VVKVDVNYPMTQSNVGWRVNNLRRRRLSHGEHSHSGSTSREGVHIELPVK
jgi:hypothetical protein